MANVDAFQSGFSMGQKQARGGKGGEKPKDKDSKPEKGTKIGNDIKSFKKGGSVKKTGVYRLHAGEEVIPAKRSGKRGKTKNYKKATSKR
jgi:hypothetical protein